MKAGVCSWVFNRLFTAGEIAMSGMIEFVGRDTAADCFEPLSRYWDPDRPEDEQAAAARRLLDEVGLEVSCYTLDSDFAVYDEPRGRECVAECIARLDIARSLGTDTIRLDPRSSLNGRAEDEVDLDDLIARMARGMAEVCDAAAERGMTVGIENHGRLLGRSDRVAQLLDAVDRPNCGVNLDFTNFRTVFGEDHIAVARRFARRTVHVHAKDLHIRSQPGELGEWRQIPSGEYVQRAIGGEGNAGWREIFGILKEAGYDGTISLEISDPDDIFGSVRAGVANLKRLLAETE